MNKLKQFCQAIIEHEQVQFLAQTNNPGALKKSKFESGDYKTKDGRVFSIFPSYEIGVVALRFDIRSKCVGNTSHGLGLTSTILQLFEKYAGAPGDYPRNYALEVAAKCNLTINDTLDKVYTLPSLPEQKILVVLANKPPSARMALAFLVEWFEVLGIKTTLTIVDDYFDLGFVTLLQGIKVVDPRLVEFIASRHLKDHHFVLFCYRSGTGQTPIEYPKIFLGSVVTQIPVLSVSRPWYTTEYMVHELLHGWYFRAGKVAEDDVHQKSFSDARPEFNYESIVEKLRPDLEMIFKPQTFEEKKIGYLTAIRDFLMWAIEVLKKKVGA